MTQTNKNLQLTLAKTKTKKWVKTKVLMFLWHAVVLFPYFYHDQRDGVYQDQSYGVFIIKALSNILKQSKTIVEYNNVMVLIRIKVMVFYHKSTVEKT